MNIYSHFSASGTRLECFPFVAELAMEGYIAENPDLLKLSDDDEIRIIEIEKDWKRCGERGRIDLLASYGDSVYAVVELKNGELTAEAFAQLKAYFEDKNHLEAVAASLSDSLEDKNKSWLGVLVGVGINAELKTEIEKFNLNSDIPFSVIILNRYKSGNQIYTLTDIAVPPKKTKDHSVFEFKGVKYKKNRLVLAMIKTYVEENYNKLSSSDLIESLSVSGKIINISGKPILIDYDSAVQQAVSPNSKGNTYRYYFIKPEEAVLLKDRKLAVLDWWTKDDRSVIEKIAQVLGFNFKNII